MGTQRAQMKGVLRWLVRWACRVGTRDFCPVLAAQFTKVFPNVHYKLGRKSCWVTCLLVCVSGCDHVIIGTSKNYGLSSSVCTLWHILPPPRRLKDLTSISYLPLLDLWLQPLYTVKKRFAFSRPQPGCH
jgi:hypothetical protein